MWVKQTLTKLKINAYSWAQARHWQARLIILLGFVYILIRFWGNSSYSSILSGLNLGIHELGHLVLSPFGTFMSVLGGTLFQLLAPFLGMVNFYRQNDFFSIALCFCWLSTSLFDVARYVADARAMNLPLLSPFGSENVIHDWNYLLSKLGLLRFDQILAHAIVFLASLAMLAGLISGAWIIWVMFNTRREA